MQPLTRSLAQAPATHDGVDLEGEPMGRADADMVYLLDVMRRLGSRPIEHCGATEARQQPSLADATASLLLVQGRSGGDDGTVGTEDIAIPGPDGDIPARLYRAAESEGDKSYLGRPVILYIHGGGWVVGDLDAADAVPRALAERTGALVLSTHYRLAPEHKFPAAHDDIFAVWSWLAQKARGLGGDPRNIALVGEEVGANMAMNIALATRNGAVRPVHQVLVHPLAGTDMGRPSYVANMRSRPLNTFTMRWFVRHALANRDDATDPRINLLGRDDFAGLPPTTMILAEIDPLRSEGEDLGAALQAAGVDIQVTTYAGVTHGFFGLGRFVNKAMFAQTEVANRLLAAFERRTSRD